MKDIIGYEGLYGVTTCGKVWSYKTKIFLKSDNNRGYLRVRLCKDGKKKAYLIHRLVGQTYIPNPENKEQINHKNGIKTDNYIGNLEFCTRSENAQHAWSIGLNKPSDKQKLTASKIGKIYGKLNAKPVFQLEKYTNKFVKLWDSLCDIEKELGINRGNISKCCLGKVKSVGGYIWKYK
jgi:hypothetical protein